MFGGDLPSPNESQPATNLEHNGDLSGGNLGFQFDSATSSDVLAKGISSMLGSVIKDFDHRAENAIRSQDALSISIDRLTGELDQLLEDAPLPFIMQHAVKISGVRKRVSSLNSLLKSIQRRIDNIDRMLSVGSSHDLPNSQNVRQHQDTNKGSAGPETEPAKVQVDLPMTSTTDS